MILKSREITKKTKLEAAASSRADQLGRCRQGLHTKHTQNVRHNR